MRNQDNYLLSYGYQTYVIKISLKKVVQFTLHCNSKHLLFKYEINIIMLLVENITFITNKQTCITNYMNSSFIENLSKKCVNSGMRTLHHFNH